MSRVRGSMSARLIGTLAVALAATAACGSAETANPAPLDQLAAARDAMGNAENVANAYKDMGATLAQMGADSNLTVEPVDFRLLRDLLPAELGGLPRAEAGGEKVGAMGMNVSKAEGRYHAGSDDGSPGSPSLTVTITDMGALRGTGMMSMAAWSMIEVDNETAAGFERTSKYKGHPAYETFNTSDGYRNGTAQVVVAARFMVVVEGDNLDFERIRSALEAMPVDRLEKMKELGVTRGR